MVYALMLHDLIPKYRTPWLGVGWSLLQSVSIAGLVAATLGMRQSDSIQASYFLFTFAGIVPWSFFSQSLSKGAFCLIHKRELVKKASFPRFCIVLSTILGGFLEWTWGWGLLIVLALFLGAVSTQFVLIFPCLLVISLVTCLGLTLWLSALCTVTTEFRYTIPFLQQAFFFATPILYELKDLPYPLSMVVSLNPFAFVITAVRWSLLSGFPPPTTGEVMVGLGSSLALLVSGYFFFHYEEKYFAEVI